MTGPLRPLEALASLVFVSPVTGSAAVAYRTAFFALSRIVAGRRLGLRLDDTDLTMTVADFDSRLDIRALTSGQLGNVRLAVRDIDWGGTCLEHASAALRNVRVRPTTSPTLVAASVGLTIDIGAAALDELFSRAAPRLRGRVDADGIPRVRLHRGLGRTEVELATRVDGPALRLVPRAVSVGRHRWRLPAKMPGYSIDLPPLPQGFALTDVGFAPGLVRIEAMAEDWTLNLSRLLY